MNGEKVFEVWAPDDAVWSPWCKPVLFAQAGAQAVEVGAAPACDTSWCPAAARTAIVLDLPGIESVGLALSLADKGYRPVPLFNATVGPLPLVPVEPLRDAVFANCDRLARANVRADAPPVFVLDAARRGTSLPASGKFDNRWMVFPQDFPSANFLLSQRIEDVLLVAPRDAPVADDLAHVLLRWKQGGLSLRRKDHEGGTIEALDVRRPPRFKSTWYRALILLGMRRNAAGGFGSIVPAPSSGGGYG